MGTLYLVRHGQASFGAADYDQLSALGAQQCRALGEWFRARDIVFEAALRGTLKRHAQSLAALAEGHGSVPEALEWPGLNEYDGYAVVRAVHPEPLGPADTPEAYRHHFRILREGLTRWMSGSVQPEGMPSYADWVAGIAAALDHVRSRHSGHVLVVSSGGPIATAVGQVLGAPAASTIDLNMQLCNSAVTQFRFSPERHTLVSFNHLPHLEHDAERRGWVTRT
jgi:broad specificity phosphatase PhoE